MRSLRIKGLTVMAGLIFVVVFAAATDTSAQSQKEIERERQRIERQRQNNARQSQRSQQQRARQNQSRDYDNNNRPDDGRVTRAGVNATVYQGYQKGLLAGQSDRRANKYNRFNVYRNTGSAPNSGDPTSYDYLYRQGYLEGYEDGFRGRARY